MRAVVVGLFLVAAACGPRQVEVRTAPTQTSDVAIQFTNNLSRAVNVYVNAGQSDLFLRQVSGNTVEHLPVPGISAGTRVTLKAKPVDGSSGYERSNVTLTQTVSWTIP